MLRQTPQSTLTATLFPDTTLFRSDWSDTELATTVLGVPLTAPVAVAPTTLQRLVHPEGELAMARACASAGSLMVVSSNAGTPFGDIEATGVRWWLQAYLTRDRSLSEPVVDAAVAAGARAIVLDRKSTRLNSSH